MLSQEKTWSSLIIEVASQRSDVDECMTGTANEMADVSNTVRHSDWKAVGTKSGSIRTHWYVDSKNTNSSLPVTMDSSTFDNQKVENVVVLR